MLRSLLALGSNVGDRQASLDAACDAIRQLPQIAVIARSGVYRTSPIGGPAGQAEFLNASISIETELPAEAVLEAMQSIERDLGRTRHEQWAARTIDLDLLLYGDQQIDTPRLVAPHPRMSFRPFVLQPAVEIAGNWRHPLLDCTLDQLWRRLTDGDDGILLYGGAEHDRHWHAMRLSAAFAQLRLSPSSVGDDTLTVAVGSEAATQISSPKLAIQLKLAPTDSPRPGLPTLALPAAGREEVVFESIAAIQAVWPDLCRTEIGE